MGTATARQAGALRRPTAARPPQGLAERHVVVVELVQKAVVDTVRNAEHLLARHGRERGLDRVRR
jgi:hypothetical protein